MLERQAVAQLDHTRQEAGVDDEHARPAVVQAPAQPLALVVDVGRHPDGAQPVDREAQQHELGAALHQHRDGVAPAHPERPQPGGELVGAGVDVGEREAPVARHDEHVVAHLIGLQSQHPVEQAVVAVGEVEPVHRGVKVTGHARQPAHVARVHAHDVGLVDLEVGEQPQQLLDRDARLQSGQGRAQADVRTVTEAQRPVDQAPARRSARGRRTPARRGWPSR